MSKIKIVLAEDEPSLGQILKESLETRGFLVYHAPNGKVAYDYYLQRNPDILVLDVMMPIKDGFTLAKEIRKENTSIPIIFLTAKSQIKDVLDGFDNGGNDYLKKPFSMEELIVRIKALLDRNEIKKDTSKIAIGNYIFNYTRFKIFFTSLRLLIVLRFGRISTSLKSSLISVSIRGIFYFFQIF